MTADRIRLLAEDLYNDVFATLDAEIDCDSEAAGRVASAVENAFTLACAQMSGISHTYTTRHDIPHCVTLHEGKPESQENSG